MKRSLVPLGWVALVAASAAAASCGGSGDETASNGGSTTTILGVAGKAGAAGAAGKAGAQAGAGGAAGQAGGKAGGAQAGTGGASGASGGGGKAGGAQAGAAGQAGGGGKAGGAQAGAAGQAGSDAGCTPQKCDDGIACTVDACDASGQCTHTPKDSACDDGNACNGAETCVAGKGCTPGSLGNGIIVMNPPDADLVITDGAPVPGVAFSASIDGVDITQCLNWSLDNSLIGDLAGTTFTASGVVGGKGTITAATGSNIGVAGVSVTLKTTNTNGVPPDQTGVFNNPPGGDPGLSLLYPYDKTVFPLGVVPPEMQWSGSNPDDVFKLTIKEQFFEYVEYFTAPPPSRHVVPDDVWKKLGESGQGAKTDPVSITLQRASGGSPFAPVTQTWRIAQGTLAGSLYYWELPDACGNGNGRILRIKPGSTSSEEPYNSGGACYGCHTVSRDGTRMMAAFDQGSPFPFQSIDLSTSPAQLTGITSGSGLTGTFSAYNDKGDRILMSADGSNGPGGWRLRINDSNTGATLNGDVFPSSACGEPAWSPDGKKIAAVCNLQGGGWTFDATGGDLVVADVADDGFSIGQPSTVSPSGEGQGRPAYPSFSPGSNWLVYGRPTAGARSTGNGDLWISSLDGQTKRKLATAASDNRSFNPVFAPIRAGGYFWVAFISRRDYGNTIQGANRQQLWVTAIEDPPTGDDPSQPPYYVRGQENCAKSENAYFALDPCKPDGTTCSSGVDCCNGSCIKDPGGSGYLCGKPPANTCSQMGNACKTTPDCCGTNKLVCIDGFCQTAGKPLSDNLRLPRRPDQGPGSFTLASRVAERVIADRNPARSPRSPS
jgi:hypothetical protein